jgi:hypothetical protein
MPHQKLAQAVLAQWRAVELAIAELESLGPEADELKLEAYRLRNDYQHLIEQAIAHHRPEPLLWPELGGHERGLAEA